MMTKKDKMDVTLIILLNLPNFYNFKYVELNFNDNYNFTHNFILDHFLVILFCASDLMSFSNSFGRPTHTL
jgi:hypothetical protein